tara:strand:- start:180 stop:374 length:195 start_codon:yes stop_codon:yes gene_type:complete
MPLNNKEQEIIWKTFKTLRSTSVTISECQDLWLSDIREIEMAYWRLFNKFEFIRDNCEKEKKND